MHLGPYPDLDGYDRAVTLDSAEPLTAYRERFVVEEPDLIYLDGNSLGRLPRSAAEQVAEAVQEQWGRRLIRSWNDSWWDLQLEIGDMLAPILGAAPGQVLISDSTTVNLYKLARAAMRLRPGRSKVLSDDLNFPGDVYVLESAATDEASGSVRLIPSDGVHGPFEDLVAALDDDVALVSVSATAFKSGYTYDFAALADAVHAVGALLLLDLSHAVGVVDQSLDETGVDLAVGCTYKYLNGGPGAPAFLYVRHELQESLGNPIQGWFAHADPFSFDLGFRPTNGVRRYHVGTMPVLSLVGCRAGIEMVAEVGVEAMRRASLSLTTFAEELFDDVLAPRGFEFASPRDPARRGSHLSIAHDRAWQLTQALTNEAEVVPDFRAPRHLRWGFAPLYTTHVEIHTAVHRLARIVDDEQWRAYPESADGVT